MKTFLKILFLLVLISALGIVTTFPMYKCFLFDKARSYLSEKLSACTEHSIDIGSLDFSSLFTLKLSKVRISDKTDPLPSLVNINTLQISCDLSALLKNKQLETTIHLDGIEKNGMIADAIIKTYSSGSDSYKTVFSPRLITNITVIDSTFSSRSFHFEDINGNIAIDKLSVSTAKACFEFKGKTYLIKFRPLPDETDNYKLSLSSDNMNLESHIIRSDTSDFLIEYLTGSFYCLDLDLSGHVKDLSSKTMDIAFDGEVKTDLATLKKLPGEVGQLLGKLDLSGIVGSKVNFKSSDPLSKSYDLQALFSSALIRVGKITFTKADARMNIEDGRLNIPIITADLYGGKFHGDMKLDIQENGLPYILSFSVDNMFLDEFIEDISGKFSPVYGNTFAKLYLKGYAIDDASAEGTLDVEISDADLGPMPLIAPLLGDIYSILRNTIIAPENRVNISQAYGEFKIKDREISTTNASLWGNKIAIIGTGYMDFDGNLNFTVENKFTQNSIEQIENWQTSIRDTIIRFGKALGKAQLKGTILKPKWVFNYFGKE